MKRDRRAGAEQTKTEMNSNKNQLSAVDRERAYAEARARIFGEELTSTTNANGLNSTSGDVASSVNEGSSSTSARGDDFNIDPKINNGDIISASEDHNGNGKDSTNAADIDLISSASSGTTVEIPVEHREDGGKQLEAQGDVDSREGSRTVVDKESRSSDGVSVLASSGGSGKAAKKVVDAGQWKEKKSLTRNKDAEKADPDFARNYNLPVSSIAVPSGHVHNAYMRPLASVQQPGGPSGTYGISNQQQMHQHQLQMMHMQQQMQQVHLGGAGGQAHPSGGMGGGGGYAAGNMLPVNGPGGAFGDRMGPPLGPGGVGPPQQQRMGGLGPQGWNQGIPPLSNAGGGSIANMSGGPGMGPGSYSGVGSAGYPPQGPYLDLPPPPPLPRGHPGFGPPQPPLNYGYYFPENGGGGMPPQGGNMYRYPQGGPMMYDGGDGYNGDSRGGPPVLPGGGGPTNPPALDDIRRAHTTLPKVLTQAGHLEITTRISHLWVEHGRLAGKAEASSGVSQRQLDCSGTLSRLLVQDSSWVKWLAPSAKAYLHKRFLAPRETPSGLDIIAEIR
eukprot:gene4970-6332_t